MTVSSDNEDRSDPGSKSFLGHLEDLRSTIIWCLICLVAGVAIAAPLAPQVLDLVMEPLRKAGVADPSSFLKVLSVYGGFSVSMKIAIWCGILLAVPGMLFAIGNFVFPGLKPRERKAVCYALGFAGVLFLAGVWSGYELVLPVALKWLFQLNRWLGVSCDFVDLSDYLKFVGQTLLCFGLAFELPVVVVALGLAGIIKSSWLRTYRRHSAVALLIAASILTPGPDPVSMVIVAIPMLVLYEVCIWIIWARERRRETE